jgi:hypothetical protein
VNLPVDFQRLLPALAVGIVALAAAVLVARGLGGGSTGASAQQVLDRAFKEEPHSAAVNLRFTFSAQTGGQNITLADTVASGSTAEAAPGKSPRESSHTTEHFAGKDLVSLDEVSTGDRGYIRVDGRWYELSGAQLKRVFGPDRDSSLIEGLGFDPQRWMRNPKVESTNADVGGVKVNQISGDVNTDAFLADLGFYDATNAGSAEAKRFVGILKTATKHGTMSLFAGKQDGFLRKLSVSAQADAAKGTPPVRTTITFALGLDKVNQPVTPEAPKSALPPAAITQIPRAKLGSEADDILGPATPVAGKPSGTGSTRRRPRGSATGTDHQVQRKPRRSAQAYLGCVQAAQALSTLERCQALLP